MKNEKIAKYVDIFMDHMRVINISSKKSTKKDIMYSIEDALVGLEFIGEESLIADIGTGGGLPGIPLAIYEPGCQFVLADSCRKKCSFLKTVKHMLNLENVTVQNLRTENLPSFPCVITRAAFSVGKISELAPCVQTNGCLIIWSTPREEDALVGELAKVGLFLDGKRIYKIDEKPRAIFRFTKP